MAILQSKTPCIEAPGFKDRDGYGRKWDGKKTHRAHRYAWEQVNGPIPKGLIVRHLCHNPSCINVEHLAIGTTKDNIQDDFDAGKPVRRGIANGNSKLTEQQIKEIKKLNPRPNRTPRGLLKQVSEDYKVTKQMILLIWNNKNWKHL